MSKRDQRRGLRDGESFPVYTVRELAAMLQVQPDTLRKWRVAGTGPKFIRESARSVVYLRESVHEWLKKRERRVQISYPRSRRRRTTRADGSPSNAQPPGAPRKGARLTVVN